MNTDWVNFCIKFFRTRQAESCHGEESRWRLKEILCMNIYYSFKKYYNNL
jgi:hypothetical protein